MPKISRREFLSALLKASAACAVSTSMVGCGSGGGGSDDDDEGESSTFVSFDHGVASGDPLADAVILWTRVTPEFDEAVRVTWEIATDNEFRSRAALDADSIVTTSAVDYTVKVDVKGLMPNTRYYFRFTANGYQSPVGTTKTLPSVNDTSVSSVRLAVFSCANYPKGYFNVYAEASMDEALDAVVHLGDYIYEYGTYLEDDPALGLAFAADGPDERALPQGMDTECLTLSDYRKRYALYRTDMSAQALHAKVPFICVWDDHEIANDSHAQGAENHQPGEGDFAERKAAALQAYFEWLPIRLPAQVTDQAFTEAIYRQFQFGTLVNLMMLETRISARDEQLMYEDYPELVDGGDATRFRSDLTSPQRSLVGAEQLQWLQHSMATSSQTWQVLGQQVLMARMQLPAELLPVLLPLLDDLQGDQRDEILEELNKRLVELISIKRRVTQGDPTLTPEELSRVTNVLPYNLDAWDGYDYEREVILGTALDLDKNLVVLAGDTHNAHASDLKAVDVQTGRADRQAGVEFATASVTSPGLEEYISLTTPLAIRVFEGALQLLIDDLRYENSSNRGYMTVTFTESEAIAEWRFVNTINSTNYSLLPGRLQAMRVTTASRRIESFA